MYTIQNEASECVGFEPMLVRPPGVGMDDKEHGTVIECEREEPKMKIFLVSSCLEGGRRSCTLVNEYLELSVLLALLIIFNQLITFLATPPAAAKLGPLNCFRSWCFGSVFNQRDIVHVQSLDGNMMRSEMNMSA